MATFFRGQRGWWIPTFAFVCSVFGMAVEGGTPPIRLGNGLTVVAVHPGQKPRTTTAGSAMTYPHPRPRLVGFSPWVAITTSSKRATEDLDFEHHLTPVYDCGIGAPRIGTCGALSPPANQNFVVGFLDSGSVSDLVAGSGAYTLGLYGDYVTSNVVQIGGVGGTVDALVSQPVGLYATGLGNVFGGVMDVSAARGHWNVSVLVAPPFDCGGVEVVSAVMGTPFLAFFNTIIRVDTPRTTVVNEETFTGPDVQLLDPFDPLPQFAHAFAIEFGGLLPATTASYFYDVEDLVTPVTPTMLSFLPISLPTGGAFFASVSMRMGEPSPTNLPTQMRLLVDTGSQTGIISPAMAAELNLPFEPDFTLDACGVGGLIQNVPGYFIDYVKINALGGPLEYSRTPVVMLDLASPELGSLDGVVGMNLFWDRNVILEPSLTSSAFFHVSDPIPVPFGDLDVNLRVDALDGAVLLTCVTGPNAAALSPECEPFDGRLDGDVDLHDLAAFQNCFSGDQLADPNCAP